jgi:O-methyltransferase involved in polyketide biosynthesis
MAMPDVDVADLGPVAETLLIPLYGRATLTARGSALISDPRAVEMVEAIDYDFGVFDGAPSLFGAVLRTRVLDVWVQRWLSARPAGTVVELGAGLNTRYERLDNGLAHWLEVDLPDAMALRRRFFTDTERRRMLAGSATGDDWVAAAAALPGPWLVVAEAVLCFLGEADVRRALGHVVGLASGGPPGSELAVDTWGTWLRDHQDDHDALKVVDARVEWFCDTPAEIEALTRGLRATESITLADAPAELLDRLAPDEQAIVDASRGQPQMTTYRLNRLAVDVTRATRSG